MTFRTDYQAYTYLCVILMEGIFMQHNEPLINNLTPNLHVPTKFVVCPAEN